MTPTAGTTPPRLAIACSSAEGKAHLERIAAELLERMEPELAARLARRVMVFALDGRKHTAFAQGLGGPQDVTQQLAREQLRQGEALDPSEPLTVIVIQLAAEFRQSARATLAHELGHVALGHTEASAMAAAALTDEELTAIEVAADEWAARLWR